MSLEKTSEPAQVSVENIGGIDSASIILSPGVNILVGRNATNRTSMLRAIMAALGSDRVSLKGDAAHGRVELEFGDQTYSRELNQQNGAVQLSGDPYLEDPEAADLFAFLLEDNRARQAIIRGDDLRDVTMQPVDIDEIEAEIDRLRIEIRDVDAELDRLEELESKQTTLEQRRLELKSQISEKRAKLESKRSQLKEMDASLDESKEQRSQREEVISELRDVQTSLENIRYELDSERESIDALKDDKFEIEDELAKMGDGSCEQSTDIEVEIERLRKHKQSLDETIAQLQQIIQFNQNMLEGDTPEFMDDIQAQDSGAGGTQPVTDRLVADTITCWTCGGNVDADAIAGMVDRLREFHQAKISERNTITDDLADLTNQLEEIEAHKERRRKLEDRLESVESEIGERQATVDSLEIRQSDLEAEVEDLEMRLNELEGQGNYEELLTLHKSVNQLENEISSHEGDLGTVEGQIQEITGELERRDELESRRTDIEAEVARLRTRIKQMENEAVEEFNKHMQSMLNLLEFGNLDRIWLERVERDVLEGRKKVTKGRFELHVVRSTDEGVTYEDTVDHLSESEREVTGLVFALAGYLVHEVYESVPFMLLDSLESIDAKRITTLISYLNEYTRFLVASLLPEDSAMLPDDYSQITEL